MSRVTPRGFTLVEMLVVMAILGILAGLTVAALKNIGKSNSAVSASRQLLDGVSRARQLAIANHTTVYMVFVPTNFWGGLGGLTSAQMTVATNLCGGQLSGFTFVADGALGDQPGQHVWHYLAPWQNLPDDDFIAEWKFGPRAVVTTITDQASGATYLVAGFDTTNNVPFPTQDSPPNANLYLPYIAFNYQGQLVSGQHEYLPLARGSVWPALDPSTKSMLFNPPSVTEMPPGNSTDSAYNLVDIDPLTGRATLRYQQVQ